MQHPFIRRRAHAGAGVLLVITAALLWSTVGVAGAIVHERSGLTPVQIGFWRLAAGAAGTLPLLLRHGAVRALRPDRARLAGVGIALAAYQACYFAAVTLAGVSLATLVTLGIAPVLVAVGSRVLLGEAPERATVMALVAALAGLALLVGAPAPGVGSPVVLAGAGLALGSALGYAGVTLVSRRRDHGAVAQFAAASFCIGAAAALPLTLWDGLALPRDAVTLLLLVYLGAGPTALAYVAFFRGLRTVRATTAAVLTLIEPAAATLLAVVLLGERLGPWGLVGATVLMGTAALLAIAQARGRPAGEAIGPAATG